MEELYGWRKSTHRNKVSGYGEIRYSVNGDIPLHKNIKFSIGAGNLAKGIQVSEQRIISSLKSRSGFEMLGDFSSFSIGAEGKYDVGRFCYGGCEVVTGVRTDVPEGEGDILRKISPVRFAIIRASSKDGLRDVAYDLNLTIETLAVS